MDATNANNVSLIRICLGIGEFMKIVQSVYGIYTISLPQHLSLFAGTFLFSENVHLISLKRGGCHHQQIYRFLTLRQPYRKPILHHSSISHIYSYSRRLANTQRNQLYLSFAFFRYVMPIHFAHSFAISNSLSQIRCGQTCTIWRGSLI